MKRLMTIVCMAAMLTGAGSQSAYAAKVKTQQFDYQAKVSSTYSTKQFTPKGKYGKVRLEDVISVESDGHACMYTSVSLMVVQSNTEYGSPKVYNCGVRGTAEVYWVAPNMAYYVRATVVSAEEDVKYYTIGTVIYGKK